MTSSDPIHTYNEIAADYLETFDLPTDHIDIFANALKKGATVLDIGCGPGVDAAYLLGKGFQVHAVDGSEAMIDLARKQAAGATFETGDMRDLDLGYERYDGVVASYSLIHIPKADIPDMFVRIVDALKPSGTLFLCLQVGRSEEIELDEPLNPDLKIFLNIFSKEEVHRVLDECRMTLLEEYERCAEMSEEFEFIKYYALARKEG